MYQIRLTQTYQILRIYHYVLSVLNNLNSLDPV